MQMSSSRSQSEDALEVLHIEVPYQRLHAC